MNLEVFKPVSKVMSPIKLYVIPHFQVEGMDIGLSLVSKMPKSES